MRWAVPFAALLLLAPVPVRAASGDAPRVGGSAPVVDLADVDGRTWKIEWREGGSPATIVYFFDPQSPNCLLQMSFLDGLHALGKDYGLAVYAIESKGRQPAEMSRMLERYCAVYRPPSFPVLPDPAFRANRLYDVKLVPTTFVTESHGVVLDRIEGYDHGTAVAVTRRVEKLLRQERGRFSRALREVGIQEEEEREEEARRAAAMAAAPDAGRAARALAAGERAPAFEFTDLAGVAGMWDWAGGTGGVRVLFFWGGGSLPSIEELTWLDPLARRGREVGLEVIAVEASGLDDAAVRTAVERYSRMNPLPSFPVVADPQKRIARLFGPWERLPQTYLMSLDGTVVYHADGFDDAEAALLGGKVERSFLLAGRPLPDLRGADTGPAMPAADEAPSIRERREREDRYRSNSSQGNAAFLAWEFDKALGFFLEALRDQPDDLGILVRTAQIYERRGDSENALTYWERALAVRPDHPEALARVRSLRPLLQRAP